MKIAILDLGTNTFHLLIAEVFSDHFYKIIFRSRKSVKLGEDSIGRNEIGAIPFQRGLKAIRHYQRIIQKFRVTKVYAFATSAIRSAGNGKLFVAKVRTETGIKIKVIQGEEEAKLIYLGVRQCLPNDDEPSMIMDIGGGSTEFIIASNKMVFWKMSFNIGAARLLERFHPSDPISHSELKSVEAYLRNELKPLRVAIEKYPVSRLVGSSGSFETFISMINSSSIRNQISRKKLQRIELKNFYLLHNRLVKSSTAERLKMKGLIRMRIDMIVLASICANFVIKEFGIKEIFLAKYALKEGAAWKIVHQTKF